MQNVEGKAGIHWSLALDSDPNFLTNGYIEQK